MPRFWQISHFFYEKMWKKWFFPRKLCSETLEIRGQILPNIFEGFGIKIWVKKNFEIFPFWQSHLHIVVKFRGKLRLRVSGQLLAYVQGATISNGFKIGPFVGSLWFFKVLPNLLPYCPLNRLYRGVCPKFVTFFT